MNAATRIVPLLTLCPMLASTPARATQIETPQADPGVVVSASLGVGSMELAGALGLSLPLAEEVDLVVRLTEVSEFNILSPSDLAGDVAVLVGKRTTSEKAWARAAAGVAWVRSTRFGDGYACELFFCEYDEIRQSTLGLALQGDAIWAIGRWIGVGASAFGNVNPNRSFAGFTIGLYLGRLR